jgi:hypothetical protein
VNQALQMPVSPSCTSTHAAAAAPIAQAPGAYYSVLQCTSGMPQRLLLRHALQVPWMPHTVTSADPFKGSDHLIHA